MRDHIMMFLSGLSFGTSLVCFAIALGLIEVTL